MRIEIEKAENGYLLWKNRYNIEKSAVYIFPTWKELVDYLSEKEKNA